MFVVVVAPQQWDQGPDAPIRDMPGHVDHRCNPDATWDVTLGTDFSGMDTPRVALENRGFRVRQRFRCEINPACQVLTKHVFPDVDIEQTDISTRECASMPPVDCYVAGVPCQPWSTAGKRLGWKDPRGRLWVPTLKYVVQQKPKTAIFENVKGLRSNKNRPILNMILGVLRKAGYTTWHTVLDTAKHGIPQHRERLYIVAVRANLLTRNHELLWPAPLMRGISLRKLLGSHVPQADFQLRLPCGVLAQRLVLRAIRRELAKDPSFNLAQKSLVVDIGCSMKRMNHMVNRFPTITSARARSCGWWIVNIGRQVTLRDLFLLQGIDPNAYDYKGAGISASHMGSMLGNAMSLNILERLLPRVLDLVGIKAHAPKPDKWEQLDHAARP